MLCRISSRDNQVNLDARKVKVSGAGDEASRETAATRTVENRARGISSSRDLRPSADNKGTNVWQERRQVLLTVPRERVNNTKDQMLLLDCTVVYSTPRYRKHIGVKEALLGSSGIARKLHKEMKGRIKGGASANRRMKSYVQIQSPSSSRRFQFTESRFSKDGETHPIQIIG
jgi:hypothetical protein